MYMKRILIVGGGFAGLSCAHTLINDKDIHVTLIDKNNYHKFTPLLYQVATSALSVGEAATSFRHYFSGRSNIDIKMAHVSFVDPTEQAVTTEEGLTYRGDILVLAAGSVVNFFDAIGAQQYSFPLYTLNDAERLRSRIIAAFEAADRNPALIDQGVLNFVIVGAGPTGVEICGALSDMLNVALPNEFSDLAVKKACVYLVDSSHVVLKSFTKASQEYTAKILQQRGIKLTLGLHVKEVASDHILLSNGETIISKTVIWAGGLQAAPLASHCELLQGDGSRIGVLSDLTVEGFPNVYAIGDFANITGIDGMPLPQLAAVAKQSGEWAAKNIAAQLQGNPRMPFRYNDKGMMAMIGRNAAIAEIGKKRRELKGFMAYIAWLGVHAVLLPTLQQKLAAFFQWAWGYFSRSAQLQILDREDAAIINCHKVFKK